MKTHPSIRQNKYGHPVVLYKPSNDGDSGLMAVTGFVLPSGRDPITVRRDGVEPTPLHNLCSFVTIVTFTVLLALLLF